MYKIISKDIVVWINPILSANISLEQFGFLDRRQIHNVVGTAQEVIYSIKSKKMATKVVKMDISKDYDRL